MEREADRQVVWHQQSLGSSHTAPLTKPFPYCGFNVSEGLGTKSQ